MRSDCYVTNLVNARPPYNEMDRWVATTKKAITPDHVSLLDKKVLPIVRAGYESLMKEISLVKPKVIIPVGNYPLWALTGEWGIQKWRGSVIAGHGGWIIPTIHPAAVLRQWEFRTLAVLDFKKARRVLDEGYEEPTFQFLLEPSLIQVKETLYQLLTVLDNCPFWVDFDLETACGHITCAGISWSLTQAICIPFTKEGFRRAYWTEEEEAEVIHLIYQALTHPNVRVRGQNLLYDCQYTYRHWCFIPRVAQDTMISHHVCFAGLPKSLAFQASIYNSHYRFWKEMHKTEGWKEGE